MTQDGVLPDPHTTPPRKAIALGVALLAIGLTFYLTCYLSWHGHTRGHIQEGAVSRPPRPSKHSQSTRPSRPPLPQELGLATLGTLTFLPGAYCCAVAFAAWRGIGGYTYADIPAVD